MPDLITFATINSKVKKYKIDNSLKDLSSAFTRFALETILNLNDDEIEDSITDGSADGAIDAIYINGNTVHLFNFKYAETFEGSLKNFPEIEIIKLVFTVDNIINKSLKEKDVNGALWDKVAEIWDILKADTINFKFYLCSNKNKPIKTAISKFEKALKKYHYVEFNYYDQDDLVAKIMEKKYKKVDGEISFVDNQYFDRSDGPLKGIVATVAVPDIINLVKDPENPCVIREDAFNENIRVFLKLKNRINQGIYDTAISEDRYKFWYLNNGINIVCEECVYLPNSRSPKAKLFNLQIVNGGQTTHALFEAYQHNPEALNDVLLLVKICETKRDSGISEKISETTNSQNPIRTRDLHANDGIQKKLEDQFQVLGYYYERKKNQHLDKPKELRIDSELLGQIYLAYYFDMASEAKNQKVLVYGQRYEDIFNDSDITADKMLLPYKIFIPLEAKKRIIQTKKRRKEVISERDSFISRATFHLLNAVKHIAEKENINLGNDKDINKAINKAIKYVNEIVKKEIKQQKDLYTHDKFFKEIPTNRKIRDYILSKYNK
jgi:hypothetical protein